MREAQYGGLGARPPSLPRLYVWGGSVRAAGDVCGGLSRGRLVGGGRVLPSSGVPDAIHYELLSSSVERSGAGTNANNSGDKPSATASATTATRATRQQRGRRAVYPSYPSMHPYPTPVPRDPSPEVEGDVRDAYKTPILFKRIEPGNG